MNNEPTDLDPDGNPYFHDKAGSERAKGSTSLGDRIINAVIRAGAIERVIAGENGFVFVWSANAAEQIEAAMAESELTGGLPALYRKKMTYEARQVSAASRAAIVKWAGEKAWFYDSNSESELYVLTPTGGMPSVEGDWIVRDQYGEYAVFKPDIFDVLFEPKP